MDLIRTPAGKPTKAYFSNKSHTRLKRIPSYLVFISFIGTDLLSQVPQDKPPKTAPDRPVEQPSSEPDHCRQRKKDRGRREEGRAQWGRLRSTCQQSSPVVRNKQAAVQIPSGNRTAEQQRGRGGGERAGRLFMCLQGNRTPKRRGYLPDFPLPLPLFLGI